MGSINFSLRDFYDSTSEFVGIKSGLFLNRFQISDILLTKYDEDYLKTDDLNNFIRVRSEEIEDMFRVIRKKIGNLPEISPTKKDYELLRKYMISTKDWELIAFIPSICFHYLEIYPDLTNLELAEILENKENFPKEISLSAANIGLERKDNSCLIDSFNNKQWDCIKPLSDLYDCEIKNENSLNFLDQRFIDYLAVNGNEIEKIHWRNFERFCAEFFRKRGYNVRLGPGRNDGGIDIRVYNPDDLSAPTILVQCKRYNSEQKVTIESVKAFYCDVLFEGVKEGLIATSSYIATGGKKVIDTRKYNISFAEKEKIKDWAKKMWTYNSNE